MESSLVTRNIRIGERRTSVRLEPQLWSALESIAEKERTTLNALCTRIEAAREPVGGFTSALRVYIVTDLKRRLDDYERFAAVADEPRMVGGLR